MKRDALVGKVFGLEFVHDRDIRDTDAMLTIEATCISRWREQRFGAPVDPPVLTGAAIGVVLGKDYSKVERIGKDRISIRLVSIPTQPTTNETRG